MIIETLVSNIRCQVPGKTWTRKFGRLSVTKGPPQSGKTAIAQAAQLLVSGVASGAFGREVKAEHILKLLTPDGKKPSVIAVLDDGTKVSYPEGKAIGRVTSVEVMDALLRNQSGATEFFSKLMPSAFDDWQSRLSADTRARLERRGLLDTTIDNVLDKMKAILKEAAAALKAAELLAKQLEMPIPPVKPELIRASLARLDAKIAEEQLALDAEMKSDPTDLNLTTWLTAYDGILAEIENYAARRIELDQQLSELAEAEPPVPEGTDNYPAWQAIVDAITPFAGNDQCPLCAGPIDVEAERQRLNDWIQQVMTLRLERSRWEVQYHTADTAMAKCDRELTSLNDRAKKGEALLVKHWGTVAQARERAEGLKTLHERLRSRMLNQQQLTRERQELVAQEAQMKAHGEQQLRRTNAVNAAATARQAAAAWEAVRDEVARIQEDMFQDVKRELAERASYLMGTEHGQPFELEFIEKPIFAPMLRRNGRLEEPSGFTTIRVVTALAALMAGEDYALILPEDRQSTVEVMEEWMTCLAYRLPLNVQVIVQTTLDVNPAGDWTFVEPVAAA